MATEPARVTTVPSSERDSAPWVTMVHAATHDRRYFSALVQALRDDHRLLLVDLPGHGASADLPGPYGFEEYALAVLAAMDAAGVERTHYVGTHTGAAVGIMLATRHPQRFASLVLEGPPIPGNDMPSVVDAFERVRNAALDGGRQAAIAEWYRNGRWFDVIRSNPERCRADEHWSMLSAHTCRPWLDPAPARPVTPVIERLGAIRCPVLILNGEHDVEDFLDAAETLERNLFDARRLRIAGAGGFPMWEDPDAANAEIRRHIANSS
jgi:pimeloyl-ACP methyl ester carboxylesterase